MAYNASGLSFVTSPYFIELDLTAAPAVPEPASLAIFGSALAGFGLLRRRRRKV
ncbi:MAG: PEP-CTERM sorting domain-containing protein [Acidobacteria bacterium]|nr:PEP-CTERM sorting domain-containing protein [Acidobacteriota bacterium]